MTLSTTVLRVAEAAINERKERVSLKTKSWRLLHEE